LIVSSDTLPTGRRGQIVAVGVMLAAIMLLWLAIISPLIGFYSSQAERLTEQQAVMHRMEQLVTSRQALTERAADLGDVAPTKGALLDGSSIPVATAALQGLVQETATTAGASLTSVESLPGETGTGYRRVGVKLALSASWPVLIHFLQALQESDTPMAIDDLQIHSAADAAKAADQQVFEAGFSVYAPATAEPQQPRETPAREAAPAADAPQETAPADTAPPDTAPATPPAEDAAPAEQPAEDAAPQDTPK
jgi:general secretion pathway protein M